MRLLPGAALAVATLVPALAFAQKADGPATLSREWKRLTTPNLTVVGNAREGDLRRAAEEIERFRSAVATLSSSLRLDSPVPVTVVVFRDDNAFTPLKPRYRGRVRDNIAGYFMPLPHASYIAMAPTGNREFTYQLTFHEYTHYIVNRNLKRLPFWLNEGLADFYSTFAGSEKDGRTIVGRPIDSYVGMLLARGIMPLARFISPADTARLFRDPEGTYRMYAHSWALTHYLLVGNNGARRPQLGQFIAQVARGTPPDKTFIEVFGPDLSSLDRELSAHVRQFRLPGVLLNDDKTRVVSDVAPMTEADALQIQADLLVSMGAFEESEQRLSKALALDARHLPARLTRARQRIAEQRLPEALDIVSADDIVESRDLAASFIRAEVLRAKEQHADAIAAYKRAIALNPESAYAYYGMSLSQLATGDPLASASFSTCMAISPGAGWYESRQVEAMRLGIDRFIESDAANYIRMAGWQGDDGTYVMFPVVLVHLRAGRATEAAEALTEIDAHVKPGSWQAAIAALMRGAMTAEAIVAKAGRDNGQLTEAHAYAGILASIAGRRDDAITHLEWVKEKGRKDFREYTYALGELRRLESSANK
jgi:tetratricopeptide (TPR) repeat protein